MKGIWKKLLPVACLPLTVGICSAQTPQNTNEISGSIAAIGYPVGSGFTKVNMAATSAAPQATGNVWIDPKKDETSIILRVQNIPQPGPLGAELLTYVVW